MAWTSEIREDNNWSELLKDTPNLNSVLWGKSNLEMHDIEWDEDSSNESSWDKDGLDAILWVKKVYTVVAWVDFSVMHPVVNSSDWTAPDLLDSLLLDKSFNEASESYFHTLEKFFRDIPGRGWSRESVSSSSFTNDSPTSLEWDKDPVQSVIWS